jgi:copper(I)-binding protein
MKTNATLAICVLAGVCAFALSACAGTASSLQISDVWARTVNMGAMSDSTSGGMDSNTPSAMTPSEAGAMAQQVGAVYMNIASTGAADRLIKAQADVAETVELHTVIEENGVMQMRPVPGIDVPANGSVQLKPGGFHVMLIGVNRVLIPGDKITVKLTFEKAGEREVQAEIRAQ